MQPVVNRNVPMKISVSLKTLAAIEKVMPTEQSNTAVFCCFSGSQDQVWEATMTFVLKSPFVTDQYRVFGGARVQRNKRGLRGSSLEDLSSGPEITYSYLVRESTSGILT